MTFLAQASSKSLLKLQRSQLNLQKTLMDSRIRAVTREMGDMEAQDGVSEESSTDIQKDPHYLDLQRMSERYEMIKENYESQTSLLDQQISDLENIIKTGIQSSCKFTISGG